jgi:hypothetical protein
MQYVFDAEKISLDDLFERISTTDLVPSRASLMDGLELKKLLFEQQGIKTLAQLRIELKTPARLEPLAKATSIDPQYLNLLRREIESYFPKPIKLVEFDWLPKNDISSLEEKGINDTAAFFEKVNEDENRNTLAKLTGTGDGVLEEIFNNTDLTRVQWISPTTARMLIEIGIDSPAKLEAADSEALCDALERINSGYRFFKGNIGLRDVKRLIHAAKYVSKWYSS